MILRALPCFGEKWLKKVTFTMDAAYVNSPVLAKNACPASDFIKYIPKGTQKKKKEIKHQ